MGLLADECVNGRLIAGLRGAGHDVVAVRQGDRSVIELARRDGRVVLTEDKDFGDLVVRHGLAVPGLVLDTCTVTCGRCWRACSPFVARHRGELHGFHVVVTAKRARTRRLGAPPAS
jgi:predicted nuclease of predicted toxin-antitoxin system